jgi:multidrug efflux pump subunit AcrB
VRNDRGEPQWVPALALGEWVMKPELAAITRRDGERVNNVLATVGHGVLPITVTRQVENAIAAGALQLAPGYRVEIGGSSKEQGDAVGLLLRYAPLLAAMMVGILVLSFRSVSLAGVVGLVAILSVGLGMLCLWLAGYPIGFNPLIGSAGLIGVAINGAIVMLASLEEDARARQGQIAPMVDVIVASTRHILATTFTTVGGFLPLLLFMEGSFWPPLAVVIAGGVGLSVCLSLALTPALYRILRTRRNGLMIRFAQPEREQVVGI